MAYDEQTWANGPEGGTPLSAERLNHVEQGVRSAWDALAVLRAGAPEERNTFAEVDAAINVLTLAFESLASGAITEDDVDDAVSTAISNAIQSLTKVSVGLALVDNTSDADKPVSTATTQALADAVISVLDVVAALTAADVGAATPQDLTTGLQAKVDSSTFTTALASKADLVGGKIPTGQIASISTHETITVASEAARLALTSAQVQPGDEAIVSGGTTAQKGRWLLLAADPSVAGNWQRLSAPGGVQSVNGQTVPDVVLGAPDVGAATAAQGTKADSAVQPGDLTAPLATKASAQALADEITRATQAEALLLPKAGGTLTGPLTLNADPTSALHAATQQYVLDRVTPAVSPQVQALAVAPVMTTPLTVTAQAGSGGLEFATSTVTGTLVDPSWKPTTTYPVGSQVLHPTDVKTVIRRIASGTSAATFDATEAAKWTSLPLGAQATFPMRWNCGFVYRKALQGVCFGPRAPKQVGDAQETDAEIKGVQWSIDFDWHTTAGAFEVPIYHTGQVRVVIDGKYVSLTPAIGAGGFQWQNIKYSGATAGFHRVRVEIAGQWCWTGGVKIATADRVFPPSLPATKKFVEVSDSYGEGLTGVANSGTAIQDVRAYPYLLAKILGFTDYVGSAIGQTGFTVITNKTYMDRLSDIIALQPAYLMIQGSGNDSPNRDTTLAAAALAFFQAVKTGCPNTKIVATGIPGWTVSQTIADAMTATLRTQALAAGIDFIDTTGWASSAPTILAADNNHPSYAGSEYLAWRFAAALAALWRLPV